jgi:hypothetical protein
MDAEGGYLDNLFYSTVQNVLSLPELGLRLIVKRFHELGIALTDSQTSKLRSQLESGTLDKLLIDLDDEQGRQLRAIQGEDSTTIELNLNSLDDLSERLERAMAQAVPDILQTASDSLLNAWKSQATEVLEEQQTERSWFTERVHEVWGHPIELLDMLINVCLEEGARFNNDFRDEASQNNDYVFDALTRLHARGCQVGFEILTLLKNGFADGAHARWRTLHEIAVVAMFISEHGQAVAERYLKHAAVSSYLAAKQYQSHCNALGYLPLSNEELERLKATYDSLIERHGSHFGRTYGWAAGVLGTNRPDFAAIERSVNLDHLRPFCELANITAHAGSRGIAFRIGAPPATDDLLLLAGPSLFGLADPGQNAAISIHQLTVTLLLTRPNMDRLAFAQAVQSLVDQVLDAFIGVHRRIETENSN